MADYRGPGVGGVFAARAAHGALRPRAAAGRLADPGARTNLLHPDRQHSRPFAGGVADQQNHLASSIAFSRASSTALAMSPAADLAAIAPASTAAAAMRARSRREKSVPCA